MIATFHREWWLLALLGMLHGPAAVPAAESEPDAGVRAAVERYVHDHKAASGQLAPLADEALRRALPAYTLYSLRFRQYPVAMPVPEPFRGQNLLVADRQGKVSPLVSQEALAAWFRASAPPVVGDAAARELTAGWLRLAQELGQDGYYQFTGPAEMLTLTPDNGGRIVSGRTLVTGGGRGELKVRMRWGADGKLLSLEPEGKLTPGVRPICQATRLLDRDPVVRRMAEQDLLAMGRAAGPYLRERRVRSSPPLRRAIDWIWNRILAEGR